MKILCILFSFFYLRMSIKRKATAIIEEEDDYSDSSVENNEISVDSGDDEENVEESVLVPLKKKKTSSSSSNKMSTNAAFKRAEQQQLSYRKKSTQVARAGKGGKGVVATMRKVEFNFDEIDLLDMQDNARQNITKKKHFPRGIVRTIVRAERIDFSKDRKKADAHTELVIDVEFIYDLQEENMKRSFGKEETDIDYTEASIRLHLPKRCQGQLEGLNDLTFLHGGLILCPQHDDDKWKDKKDEDKSSIPLIMLFKSKRALEKFGLTLETYLNVDEFIEEGQRILSGTDDGYKVEGVFKILFDYFKNKSEKFYAKESHRSNML